MKVKRAIKIETNKILVGDQITVKLEGIGIFTATAQKSYGSLALFLFDDLIDVRPMNEKITKSENEFEEPDMEKSDMEKWLEGVILPAFPKNFEKIIYIGLPSYGEIFGHDKMYRLNFEPDGEVQLELMKQKENRACCYDGKECDFWWLRNKYRPPQLGINKYHNKIFSSSFICTDNSGYVCVDKNGDHVNVFPSTHPLGVRPEFWIEINEEKADKNISH